MLTIKVTFLLAMVLCVRADFFAKFFGKSPFTGSGDFDGSPVEGFRRNDDLFDSFGSDGDSFLNDGDGPPNFFRNPLRGDFGIPDRRQRPSDSNREKKTTPKPKTTRKPTTTTTATTTTTTTTPAPTTAAPTTVAPTTAAPATTAPTTAAPATTAPATAATTTAPLTNKDIIRPRLTKSEEQRARTAIRDFVNEHKEEDGTHPFNAALLRLSFHDCIGPRGCDGCINHNNIANENLRRVADPLDELYAKEFEQTFTRADFYALSGIVSAEYAAELADCEGDGCVPNVPFKFGRLDCPRAEEQIHIFCPFNDDTEEFLIEQFNGTLTDEDITAIMGGHSVGRVNRDDGDAFDDTPDALDTDYYKQLINHAGWKQATGVRTSKDLDKSWLRSDGKLLMLGADISLISDIGDGKDSTCNPEPMKCPESKFRKLVKQFAEMDQKTFIDKFFKGLVKYQSKTVPGVILQDPIDG